MPLEGVFGWILGPHFRTFKRSLELYYWGPWSKRPYDSCGIASGYNRVAGNVRNAERQYIASHPGSGFGVQSNEFVEEIFYSFDVFHGANIQPDLQYIINPGGYPQRHEHMGVRNPTERAAVSQFLDRQPLKRKILHLTLVACAAVYVGQQSIQAQGVAPDGPGGKADWLPANKNGFGTSHTTLSKVWFTLEGGRLSEVYYPRLDTPSVRNLDFVPSF